MTHALRVGGEQWFPMPTVTDDFGTLRVVHIPPMTEAGWKFFMARLEEYRPVIVRQQDGSAENQQPTAH